MQKQAAYIFVDVLRFELAKELEENIEKYFSVQIACQPLGTKYFPLSSIPILEMSAGFYLIV